jgi:hypothetical protein
VDYVGRYLVTVRAKYRFLFISHYANMEGGQEIVIKEDKEYKR